MKKNKKQKQRWYIQDWAGNAIHLKGRPFYYDSFEDAEEVLSEELDENYETDRQEYEIVEVGY